VFIADKKTLQRIVSSKTELVIIQKCVAKSLLVLGFNHFIWNQTNCRKYKMQILEYLSTS